MKERWNKPETLRARKIGLELPSEDVFKEFIENIYHASFVTEEKRRLWFRVILTTQQDVEKMEHFKYSSKAIKLDKPRVFGLSELVKLAPATDPTHVLIWVQESNSPEANLKFGA